MEHRAVTCILLTIIVLIVAGCTSPAVPERDTAAPAGSTGIVPSAERSITSVEGLVAFVSDAAVYSQRNGKAAALREFADRNGSFTKGEIYIWAYDFNGTNLAHPYHPEYTGQNKLDLTDPAGVKMIEAMRDAARDGSGFVTYQFENPVTGTTGQKLAYVKKIDDTWWISSGIYSSDITIPQQTPDRVRQILEAKVGHAVAYAHNSGRQNALRVFNNASGPFAENGTYIFAFDMNGTTLAMPFVPANIGKNERDLKDINGVSIGERKIQVSKTGGGYFYYVYTNPASGKPEFKVSYVKPVDSGWVLGAGTYLPDVPVTYSQERRDALAARVGEAAAYVAKNGKEPAVREFNNPNGSFSRPDMFIFAFDTNGTLLANPYLPGIVGMNRLSDRDPYGEYPVPYIISNAENGGGFLYYFFADPAGNYSVRLKLGYSKMAGDNLVVGAGIFPDSVAIPATVPSVMIDAFPQKYSPMMSSTVGIGLVPNASGFAPANARYEWNASYGRFIDWSAPGYQVSEQGSSAVNDGGKIFWSFSSMPADNPGPVIINLTARDRTTGAILGRSALTLAWLQNFTFVEVKKIEKIQ